MSEELIKIVTDKVQFVSKGQLNEFAFLKKILALKMSIIQRLKMNGLIVGKVRRLSKLMNRLQLDKKKWDSADKL
ncbi:MAG TPA: hypothetical protein PK733_01685 [Clostridiales bacterium]|nr:hypothetical protein [Clostridiales bacterium]